MKSTSIAVLLLALSMPLTNDAANFVCAVP